MRSDVLFNQYTLTFALGIWQALGRKLDNKDISTMEFIRDGTALLCGSLDGTVYVEKTKAHLDYY